MADGYLQPGVGRSWIFAVEDTAVFPSCSGWIAGAGMVLAVEAGFNPVMRTRDGRCYGGFGARTCWRSSIGRLRREEGDYGSGSAQVSSFWLHDWIDGGFSGVICRVHC